MRLPPLRVASLMAAAPLLTVAVLTSGPALAQMEGAVLRPAITAPQVKGVFDPPAEFPVDGAVTFDQRLEVQAGETPSATVGACQLYSNLLKLMIEPGVHSHPGFVRLFTDYGETDPDLLALRAACPAEVTTPGPVLVSWDGAPGTGVRPLGEPEDVKGPVERPDLRSDLRPLEGGDRVAPRY